MLYVVKVSYKKETLPIIDDIWHLLSIMSIATDNYEEISNGLKTDGELMQFEDLKDFKQWAEDELEEDPMFLVMDTKKKSVYYYEIVPTFKFTKMNGTKTFVEIKKEAEDRRKESDKNWKIEGIEIKKRELQRLESDLENLETKKQEIKAQIKENTDKISR